MQLVGRDQSGEMQLEETGLVAPRLPECHKSYAFIMLLSHRHVLFFSFPFVFRSWVARLTAPWQHGSCMASASGDAAGSAPWAALLSAGPAPANAIENKCGACVAVGVCAPCCSARCNYHH